MSNLLFIIDSLEKDNGNAIQCAEDLLNRYLFLRDPKVEGTLLYDELDRVNGKQFEKLQNIISIYYKTHPERVADINYLAQLCIEVQLSAQITDESHHLSHSRTSQNIGFWKTKENIDSDKYNTQKEIPKKRQV